MPLYNSKALYGINKRVKNFDPAPDNRLRLNAVEVQ
jgi:peptide/nickel transport system substrate-binding protein